MENSLIIGNRIGGTGSRVGGGVAAAGGTVSRCVIVSNWAATSPNISGSAVYSCSPDLAVRSPPLMGLRLSAVNL